MALECVKEWENEGSKEGRQRLYMFFNSGEYSGASQPHRHLQFLPVESMIEQAGSEGWDLLTNRLITDPDLQRGIPFQYFQAPIAADITPDQLHQTYLRLYEAAAQAVGTYAAGPVGDLELHATTNDALPISFNLAMTSLGMVIAPRRREGIAVRDGAGQVALNGTVLSGSLMVKDEVDFQTFQNQPQALDLLLRSIGIPLAGYKEGL